MRGSHRQRVTGVGAAKPARRALAQGLLLLTCGAYGNVIRFLYPLTIPDAQFDAAMKILQDALSD